MSTSHAVHFRLWKLKANDVENAPALLKRHTNAMLNSSQKKGRATISPDIISPILERPAICQRHLRWNVDDVDWKIGSKISSASDTSPLKTSRHDYPTIRTTSSMVNVVGGRIMPKCSESEIRTEITRLESWELKWHYFQLGWQKAPDSINSLLNSRARSLRTQSSPLNIRISRVIKTKMWG